MSTELTGLIWATVRRAGFRAHGQNLGSVCGAPNWDQSHTIQVVLQPGFYLKAVSSLAVASRSGKGKENACSGVRGGEPLVAWAQL